ncbi:hypothetical protein LXL04_016478 [Taraxacum kok-saghyz]
MARRHRALAAVCFLEARTADSFLLHTATSFLLHTATSLVFAAFLLHRRPRHVLHLRQLTGSRIRRPATFDFDCSASPSFDFTSNLIRFCLFNSSYFRFHFESALLPSISLRTQPFQPLLYKRCCEKQEDPSWQGKWHILLFVNSKLQEGVMANGSSYCRVILKLISYTLVFAWFVSFYTMIIAWVSDICCYLNSQPLKSTLKKQTVFFLQTADVWSTSSAAEGCRCGPQTADNVIDIVLGSFENSYIPENPRTPPISYISQTVIPLKKPTSGLSKTFIMITNR